MGAKSGYIAKVALVYVLTFADLVINGVADHNEVPEAIGWIPFAWIGCVPRRRLKRTPEPPSPLTTSASAACSPPAPPGAASSLPSSC